MWYRFPESSKDVLCMQPPLQEIEHLPNLDLIPVDHSKQRKVEHCPYGMAFSEDKCLKLCYTHSDDWKNRENHAFLEVNPQLRKKNNL